jgi:hypothetical protein
MADRSDRKDSFLGLFVTSEMKERVQRTAEQEGVSVSETVRRRLKDLDHAADGAAAT